MEVAGLALNILPIMISAMENYKKLFLTPLARYRNFSSEAGRYVSRLETQQAIFQTQCILLLSTVVDTSAASQIVEAVHEQAESTKAEVEGRLKSVLGRYHAALVRTIKAIDAVLETIQRDCKQLSETIETEYQRKKRSKFSNLNMFDSRKSHTRQKLKFSFSESDMSANLKTLTDWNRDFVKLSSFSEKLSLFEEKELAHSRTEEIIDKHRLIGIAAEEVWQFLDRLETGGCEEHWAHLGIGHERANQDETTSGLTKFNLALCCIRTSLNLSRFQVTTKLRARGSVHDTMPVDTLQAALRSGLKIKQSLSEIPQQGIGDRVTTRKRKPAACDGPSSGRKRSRQDGHEEASDLCAFLNHPEFNRLSGSIQAFSAYDESARASNSKTICEGSRGVLRSTNLHELLQACPRDHPGNGLPLLERFRLANMISVAYFRFHSTGWAISGCNSKCICFQWSNNDDIVSDVKGLHMPYLQSRVNSTSSFSTNSSSTSNVCQSRPTCGLSTAGIFNLGILLLEIGYSMNWDTLKRTFPSQYGDDDPHSAMLQARLLLANEIPEMGAMYTGIVSKLVEGTISNIVDSDERKLEAAFMEDVVRPLEWEERRLEEFQPPAMGK